MDRGILFFNSGSKHCIHCIVAVTALRRHYSGPIAIVTEANGPGRETAEWIATDEYLAPAVTVLPTPGMEAGGHGISYYCKTKLPRLTPFDQTIFMDADTLVVGKFDELWPDPATGEVVLTQFADWVSTGGKMRQRILGWLDVAKREVDRMLEKPWPALNTGVMAWSRQSEPFSDAWTHITAKRIESEGDVSKFMADEIAAQLIYPDFPYRIMNDKFNASVVFPPAGQTVEQRHGVRIWHGHGFKFWKRGSGQHVWMKHYIECLRHNRANICTLMPQQKFYPTMDQALVTEIKSYLTAKAA